MSSFSSLETGLETSRPIETYTITLYTTVYRYTSAPSDIVYGGNTYESIPIRRTNIAVGPEARQNTLTLEVPLSNDFAQLYVGMPPARKASLEIHRLQRDESPAFTTRLEIFTGSIQSVRFPSTGVSELTAQSIEASVGRIIPRYSYMNMCNHTLYGSQCGVNANSFKFESTISAITNNVITVTGASTASFDFKGGHVVVPSISGTRLVISQTGNDLTLLAPYDTTLVGSAITCFAGCDHLVAGDCANVFNNVARFGGFPFVPNRNIFTKGLTRD